MDKQFTQVRDNAKETLIKQGSHMPQVLVFTNERPAILVFGEFPAIHVDKLKALFLAGAKLAEDQSQLELETVYFISEAWASKASSREEVDNLKVMPSQDPHRVEVLIISRLNCKTHKQQGAHWRIIRNKDEKIIDLAPFHYDKQNDKDEVMDIETPLLGAFEAGFEMTKAKKQEQLSRLN